MIVPELYLLAHRIISDLVSLEEGAHSRIAQWGRALAAGDLGRKSFLARLEQMSQGQASAGAIEDHTMALAVCEPALRELCSDLTATLPLWLLADLPAKWVHPLLKANQLATTFPSDRVLQLRSGTPATGFADYLESLAEVEGLTRGSTLLVDHNARRGMSSIRAGWDVAIYVTPDRLRRDLGLWGLLPMAG